MRQLSYGPVETLNVLKHFGLETLQPEENLCLMITNGFEVDTRAFEKNDLPLVFYGTPHVGEHVPVDLFNRMTPGGQKLMCLMDRGTELIFKSEFIPRISFTTNRFICDPNRPEKPMDEIKVPGGVLWKTPIFDDNNIIDLDGQIYIPGQEPSEAEIEFLVETFHRPYFVNAFRLINRVIAEKRDDQRMLWIDGHSCPTSKNMQPYFEHPKYHRYRGEKGKTLPLFALGDRDGFGTDPDILEVFKQALEKHFYALDETDQEHLIRNFSPEKIVDVNIGMNGVYNVLAFRKPNIQLNCIQVELNEDAYVDEEDGEWFTGKYDFRSMVLLRKIVENAALEVNGYLKRGSDISS